MEYTEISIQDVKDYLRIVEEESDLVLQNILNGAILYVVNHTGLDKDEVKTNQDLKLAILVLCSDFYWNRDYQNDNRYTNRLVDSIIENNRTNFM